METKMLLLLLLLSSIYSFSIGGAFSSVLDFVPGVGNIKSAAEAITGKDAITGEKLSWVERAFSALGAIPGGNWLKNAKHLKNGQKFIKAAQRAQKAGKIKNAVKFANAGRRAMAKANKVQNAVINGFKAAKAFFKQTKKDNDENDENYIANTEL